MKTKTIILLSKAAIIALFFCALFYVARPIKAKADTAISGNVNTEDLVGENGILALTGDTILYINEDLQINKIAGGQHNLTITGDGIHTLTIESMIDRPGIFNMQSGNIVITGSGDEHWGLYIMDFYGNGDLEMSGGTLDITSYDYCAISAQNEIRITGGRIKATKLISPSNSGPNTGFAIGTDSGDIIISGGTVEAYGDAGGLGAGSNGSNRNINISGENTIVKARATNSTGRAIDADGTLTIAPELTVTKPRGGGVSSDGKFLATVAGGSVPATDVEIRKFIPDAPEDNEEEPVDDTPTPNYFDDLTSMLEIAKEAGGAQTIYWNEGTALPGPVMKFLSENPQITLVFSYTYEGLDYTVTIPGKNVKYDPNVPWCGPLYLYGLYGRYSASTAVKTTNSTLTLGNRTYTITSGDSLWDIARRLGITVDELVRINNVNNPDRIDIGQIIKY